MNDVIGISDVSSLDTGRGKSTSLKTGGIRRNYNMKNKMKKCPTGKMYDMKLKKCVNKKGDLNKDGKMSSGKKKMSKTQKPLESPMQAKDKVGSGIADSMNARMKKRNKKNSMTSGY